ncbi:MAG TPA: tetratricopeptide repeat protein [Terriglobia bacterium]|nr:tetratricopeptide repeat protein [Terriglobia bacterium]
MRTIIATLLLGVAALISLAVSLPAQRMVQDDGELESSYHYVPPSARQSVEVGNFYLRRKDYRGALSRFEESAKDDPYYAPAYLGMGKVYEKTGRKREALAAYHKYLNALPSQKQADEAKAVHKAIRQIERQLATQNKRQAEAHQPPSSAKK